MAIKPMSAPTPKTRQESNLLYRLIGGMNKTEKRDFKLYANKYSKEGGNIYVKMFDAICAAARKHNNADSLKDADVKAEIKDKAMAPYFNSAKSKLKTMLFDYLYEKDEEDELEANIFKNLRLSQILYEKGFKPESERLLQRALLDARNEEHFALQLKAIYMQFNRSSVDGLAAGDWLYNLNEESKDALHRLDDFMLNAYVHQAAFNRYVGADKKGKGKLKYAPTEKDLLRNHKNAASVGAKVLAINSLIFHHHRLQDFDTALLYCREQVELLENTLPNTRRFVNDYFIASQNYLAILNKYHRYGELETGIRNYEAQAERYLTVKDEPFRSYALSSIDMLWIVLHSSKHDLPNALKATQKAAARFAQLEKQLTVAKKIVLISLIKEGYFLNKQYGEALQWVQRFKKEAIPGIEDQRKIANLITEVLILLETKAPLNKIKSCVASIRYAVNKTVTDVKHSEFTFYIVKEIEELIAARNKDEQRDVLNRLLEHHKSLLPLNDVYSRAIINESGYINWLKDKAASVK